MAPPLRGISVRILPYIVNSCHWARQNHRWRALQIHRLEPGLARRCFDRDGSSHRGLCPVADFFISRTVTAAPEGLQQLRRSNDRLAAEVRALPLLRGAGEVFVVRDRLFIANSDPDLVGDIGLCLARHVRPRSVHFNGRR